MRIPKITRFRFAAFLLGVVLGTAAVSRAVNLPDGFAISPVANTALSEPTGFAELPDGRFLMIERVTTQVRIVPLGSGTAPVIHVVPNVATNGERGLLGIAVDPAWPTRPYIYLYFTKSDSTAHVQMLTATGDLSNPLSSSLALTSPFELIANIPDFRAIHNGGTLRFGTDGMLYLSIGDDAVSCSAQSTTQLAGRVLRMDVSAMPGAGSGPPPQSAITPADNPFPGPGNQQLTWVWGLRNPFRFTVDPLTNDLVIGDVGLLDFEEIDVIPFSSGGGQNLGWPQREGFIDPGLGLTCGLTNPFTDPVYAYDHAAFAAVIAGPRYRTNAGPYAFPPQYDGSVFFTDIYQGWLRRLVETPSGWEIADPVPGQADSTNWATNVAAYVDMQQGADGAIYCMQLFGNGLAGLYRLAPSVPSGVPAGPLTELDAARAVPNPARAGAGTLISWTARRAGVHSMRITDVAGRIVRTERIDVVDPAHASWRWDTLATRGHSPPSGVYLYTIDDSDGRRISGKLVLLH